MTLITLSVSSQQGNSGEPGQGSTTRSNSDRSRAAQWVSVGGRPDAARAGNVAAGAGRRRAKAETGGGRAGNDIKVVTNRKMIGQIIFKVFYKHCNIILIFVERYEVET